MGKATLERNKEVNGKRTMTQVAYGIRHDQRMRQILTGQLCTDKEAHEQFMREFWAGYNK